MRFNRAAYSIIEDAGVIQLTLILHSPSSFVETVQIINSNITAKGKQNSSINTPYTFMCYNIIGEGIDYSSGPYNVTFPARSTNASLDIAINDDGILEGDETFSVYIVPFTNENIVGVPDTAIITILDTTGKEIITVQKHIEYNTVSCIMSIHQKHNKTKIFCF